MRMAPIPQSGKLSLPSFARLLRLPNSSQHNKSGNSLHGCRGDNHCWHKVFAQRLGGGSALRTTQLLALTPCKSVSNLLPTQSPLSSDNGSPVQTEKPGSGGSAVAHWPSHASSGPRQSCTTRTRSTVLTWYARRVFVTL